MAISLDEENKTNYRQDRVFRGVKAVPVPPEHQPLSDAIKGIAHNCRLSSNAERDFAADLVIYLDNKMCCGDISEAFKRELYKFLTEFVRF
jgi:hypothetical protein